MTTTEDVVQLLLDPTDYPAAGLRTWPAVGDTVRTTHEDDPDTIYRVAERIPGRHGSYRLTEYDHPEVDGYASHHELIPADPDED